MRPDVLSNDALDVRNFMSVNFIFVKLCWFHNETTLSFQNSSNSPPTIAIANENSVPRRTYSVNLKSDEFLMSENLKTDFAVIKNPTAEKLCVATKVTINILSIYPIHLPAFGRPV